jgi:hypothetical protein
MNIVRPDSTTLSWIPVSFGTALAVQSRAPMNIVLRIKIPSACHGRFCFKNMGKRGSSAVKVGNLFLSIVMPDFAIAA